MMHRVIFLVLAISPVVVNAQFRISSDTLWLHHANETEEDLDSNFPLIRHKDNPAISNLINTALQMQALGFTLTEKNKNAFTHPDANPRSRTNYSYSLARMTDRLFYVDIMIHHTDNAMSLNGWEETHRFYFDATNGQPVALRDLFSQPTLAKQEAAILAGFTNSLVSTMNHYQSGFTKDSIASMDKDCECACSNSVKTAWCQDRVRLDVDDKSHSLIFSMDACMWTNPGPHDIYSVTLDQVTTSPWLAPYGAYLLYGGTPAPNDTPFKLWKGTIGQNIPITFLIKIRGCDIAQGVGAEIYDRFGTVIPLSFSTSKLPAITLSELGADGKPVATIEAQLSPSGQLTGNWTKADKSKTLPFTASPAK